MQATSTRRQAVITAALFAHLAVAAGVGALASTSAACGVKDRTVARLDLADAKLTIDQADGRHHELTLSAKGEVAWDGRPFLVITRDGALRAGKDVLARIDKYGAVTIKGQPTNVVIRPDGSFEIDGVAELTIDRDGVVAGPLLTSLDHPAMELAGARLAFVGPARARWATLIGFAALLTPSLSPADAATPAPAPTPPTPPAAAPTPP
jgi:hypothetical protein